MRRPRVTIAGLMAAVGFVALAAAALRNPTILWSSTVYTATVGLLCATTLWAMFRRDRSRPLWAGFALFGWVYLAMCFGPWPNGNGVTSPPFLTRAVMDYFQPNIQDAWFARRRQEGMNLVHADPGERLYESTAESLSMSSSSALIPGHHSGLLPNQLNFRRIGHCLGAIAFGLIGSVVGARVASRSEADS